MGINFVTVKNEDALKKIQKQISLLKSGYVKIGWLANSKYPANKGGMNVATIAAIQEYGAPSKGIPPRSFIRSTQTKKRKEWREVIAKSFKACINGKWEASKAYTVIGATIQGDIQKTITTLWDPSLKESTIKNRARKLKSGEITKSLTKPLVDTGLMLATLTYKVSISK